MVTVGMYYDVVPGQGANFEARFVEVVNALKQAPGHVSSYLYKRVDDLDSYAILSEWNDADAFQAFIRSDAFHEVTAWGRSVALRNRPRHKIYPRSDDLGRPS